MKLIKVNYNLVQKGLEMARYKLYGSRMQKDVRHTAVVIDFALSSNLQFMKIEELAHVDAYSIAV